MQSLRDDGDSSRDGRARILLVEDDSRAPGRHRRILERAGYDCVQAGGSHEARSRLLADDVALLVVDAGMSRDAGLELSWHVLANYPATTVLVITDLDDHVLTEGALSFGACGYLVRPFTPGELTTVVANALCRRRLEIGRRAHRLPAEVARARTADLAGADGIFAFSENNLAPTART